MGVQLPWSAFPRLDPLHLGRSYHCDHVVVRAITYAVAKRRGSQHGRAAWFAVAPLGALALALLLVASVPLRVRWELSKSSFAADVRAHPREGPGWHPRRIGSYRITSVHVVPEGILFYDYVGALADDAGFAYLPGGPSTEMASGDFENPQWFALGDGWYGWTASW